MSNEIDRETAAAVTNIWSRISFRNALKRQDSTKPGADAKLLVLSAVERQTENSRKGGTIWEAVRKGDEEAFIRLVKQDPKNVDARGPVGECPVHMLFLYGSEAHLNIARYLITNFPYTITQIYDQSVSENQLVASKIYSFVSFRNIMVK